MNDLKEFLRTEKTIGCFKTQNYKDGVYVCVENLGLFFWERGGKHYAKWHPAENIELMIEFAKGNDWVYEEKDTQDFLDALACLGEDKIKELIKELKK